jgi:hypothetical protein
MEARLILSIDVKANASGTRSWIPPTAAARKRNTRSPGLHLRSRLRICPLPLVRLSVLVGRIARPRMTGLTDSLTDGRVPLFPASLTELIQGSPHILNPALA